LPDEIDVATEIAFANDAGCDVSNSREGLRFSGGRGVQNDGLGRAKTGGSRDCVAKIGKNVRNGHVCRDNRALRAEYRDCDLQFEQAAIAENASTCA
jgi:hypothetical protein